MPDRPACSCCHDLVWIDDWDDDITPDCGDTPAHDRMPRYDLAGTLAYECPHCTAQDDTLEQIGIHRTPDQITGTVTRAAQRLKAIVFPRGVHRGEVRRINARLTAELNALDSDLNRATKEQRP